MAVGTAIRVRDDQPVMSDEDQTSVRSGRCGVADGTRGGPAAGPRDSRPGTELVSIGPVNGDPTETVSEGGGPRLDGGDDDGAPRLLVIVECRRLTTGALRLSLSNLDSVTLGRDSHRHVLRQGRCGDKRPLKSWRFAFGDRFGFTG